MSHDLYASWATAELAQMFKREPSECFSTSPQSVFDIFANRESGRVWPIPDGRLSIDISNERFEIALEMKRINEGLHGILTSIGQAQAYIHPDKGYTASVIVVPNKYPSHDSPGDFINNVINNINSNSPIGVYSYSEPDTSLPSPFKNRLTCHRKVNLTTVTPISSTNPLAHQKSKNQWAHLREGSSEPDAFFRYLQIAKKMSLGSLNEPLLDLPNELIQAVNRISPRTDPIKYLSCTSNDTENVFHDVVWRNFWFRFILTDDVSKLYSKNGDVYEVCDFSTKLLHPTKNEMKKFFSGRVDSIKNKLIQELNNNLISENESWEKFAENIHNRAHSYREDIDSGLSHLGFLESDGKPSELGYRFVDACERAGTSKSGNPKLILGSAILKIGDLRALLHYFYKLSEFRFKDNPLAFTEERSGQLVFMQDEYTNWIREQLINELKVMSSASLRGGTARKPFQGELAVLRKFMFVSKFRIGVGLEINWPLIQEYMDYDLGI